jgi:hypothetical protein
MRLLARLAPLEPFVSVDADAPTRAYLAAVFGKSCLANPTMAALILAFQ